MGIELVQAKMKRKSYQELCRSMPLALYVALLSFHFAFGSVTSVQI